MSGLCVPAHAPTWFLGGASMREHTGLHTASRCPLRGGACQSGTGCIYTAAMGTPERGLPFLESQVFSIDQQPLLCVVGKTQV